MGFFLISLRPLLSNSRLRHYIPVYIIRETSLKYKNKTRGMPDHSESLTPHSPAMRAVAPGLPESR